MKYLSELQVRILHRIIDEEVVKLKALLPATQNRLTSQTLYARQPLRTTIQDLSSFASSLFFLLTCTVAEQQEVIVSFLKKTNSDVLKKFLSAYVPDNARNLDVEFFETQLPGRAIRCGA